MPEVRSHPRRFRRRLTAAFVVVAAVSSGVLALVTYGATSSYRWRNFEQMTHDEVRVALALAPRELDEEAFERLLGAYEKRSGTDTVAFAGDRTYSSSVNLDEAQVPAAVRQGAGEGELVSEEVERNGVRYLVIGGAGPGGARYAFFFALEQLQSSLAELRVVLALGWVAVVASAAAVGELIAIRTLRPVREAADAATALADGHLDARIEVAGDDEFGTWARSFNEMAGSLEETIDELARAAERERRFTSDVAHDLRTPLTGMAATASLLEAQVDELPASSRRAVTILVRDVGRLRELVLELLELSRLDAGSERIRLEVLDVEVALAATVDSLRLPDHVDVTIEVEDGLAVLAERARFRRIVGNLVSNAVSHGDGAVAIEARSEGDVAVIDVRDHGPGVPAHCAEQVFERFYKGDGSRAEGGSGLGLAIARDHARAQGGDVELVTSCDAGALFRLTLPVAVLDRSDRSPVA